jgi:hypothetical protein
MTRLSEDHKEIQSGKKLDDEGYMAKVEMQKIAQSLNKLKKVIKTSDQQLPAWVQSKITKASDYLDIAADYLASDVEMDEELDMKVFEANLKRVRKEVQDTLKKREERLKKEKSSNEPPQKPKGPELPGFVKKEEVSLVDKILAEMMGDKPGCDTKKPKKSDEVKEAKKYMTKEEDPCWKGYEMVGFKKKKGKKVPNCVPVSEATTRLPMQTGQILRVLINWRGKHLSVQMFFPQLGTPRRDEITYAVNKVYPEARVISYVPSELDSSTPIVQVREDWQKLNKKDNVDGMGEKSIKAYRRENPGSKLKPAVTEENPTGERAKRQDNYCSRAGGQKEMHNIDCSKTPDKPICKARRRWKC